MTPPTDELLTAAEVCRLLKISRRTFQRFRETGRLPPPVVQWNRTLMRWRKSEILMMRAPVNQTTTNADLASAYRHIIAASNSAIAAGHHTAAAATALRRLQIALHPLPTQSDPDAGHHADAGLTLEKP